MLSSLHRTPFGVQILLGVILGVVLGLVARFMGPVGPEGADPNSLTTTLTTIGHAFVTLLRTVVPPLVFLAVVASIANLRAVTNAARLAGQTLLWFTITALISVGIGITIGLVTNPGLHTSVAEQAATAPSRTGSWLDFPTGFIPGNVLGLEASTSADEAGALTTGLSFNVLQILVVAIAVGATTPRVASTRSPRTTTRSTHRRSPSRRASRSAPPPEPAHRSPLPTHAGPVHHAVDGPCRERPSAVRLPQSRCAAVPYPGAVPELVLASASPARLATLVAAGVDPVVVVSDVDEHAVVQRYGVTDAVDVALVLAKAKAEDVAARDDLPDQAIVLGCDSVLELDGEVHGKPADVAQAAARWRRMRGRSGVLHTGHWLVDDRLDGGSGATLGEVASTTVHFADLSDAEVDAYVATGEPLRVAGAFTVDGLGGAYVTAIDGDHHNVVGVSLPLLREMLGHVGVPWHTLWRPAAGEAAG